MTRAALRAVALLLVAAPVCAQPVELPGIIPEAEHQAELKEARGQERDARLAVGEKAKLLGYSAEQIELAMQPTMVRSGEFVVTLEDGTRIRFPWFRTGFAENGNANTDRDIARDAEGKATRSETNKGGVRLHRGVFASEVYALALKMDAKLAITGDAVNGESVRGAKGGIGAGRVIEVGTKYQAKVGDVVDPASPVLDRAEMMRGFGNGYIESGARVGLGRDIQAGDVNTKASEMKVLSDTYDPRAPSEGVSGKELLRLSDGTTDPRGGIEYRATSTGEGVWMSARRGLASEGLSLKGATVAAQGWGEVGAAFGRAAMRDGARVIAIQELWNVGGERVAGVLVHPKGDKATAAEAKAWLEAVEQVRTSNGDLKTFRNGELLKQLDTRGDVSRLRVDVVGYNALGNVLNEATVPALAESGTTNGKRKVIVEGANLAETAKGARALDALRAKLLTIPGDLANLGGVHVSNLEAVQNRYGEVVTSEDARRSLEKAIKSGWERAEILAKKHGVSMRQAIELLSADELMKRSLQLKGATKNSLEKAVLSPEAIARHEARVQSERGSAVQRVLSRLKPFRRGDGTVKWKEALRKGALREGAGAAQFALALFLKEVAVVASTGDRARIEEFFAALATTDFYKHYGLFVAGARVTEVLYTRYLQRYVKPQFVSGLLKTNLVLAAGLALPLVVDGQLEGRTFLVSLASLGLSSSAVHAGVSRIAWVKNLRQAQSSGALAKVGASAGRLARLGGWFYTVAELAVILYIAEAVEKPVNAYFDRADAREELAAAGQRLVDALANPDADAQAAVDAYHDAWTKYRNFLYRPLELDEMLLAERLQKLARKAKLVADKRRAIVERVAKRPALAEDVVARHGSLENYADALAKTDEAELQSALGKAMLSYNNSRDEHLREVYEDHRRDGALLDGVYNLDWLLAGARAGDDGDPWRGRSGLFARIGRNRYRAGLTSALEGVSRNRLQTYDDEAEVLAALAQRMRSAGRDDALTALEAKRTSTLRLRLADEQLVRGDGLVTNNAGLSGTLERANQR